MALANIEKYLRMDKLPHIWCPGCGNGIVLQGVLRGLDKLGVDQNKVAVVSGIGCSSRSAGYVDFNTLHTAHGRAIPFATGIKLAKPEMHVIVITGDGDAAAIGGNHFIHAARRNIDITVVVFNNSTYGMTSGQYSPLTPTGAMAATAPYGNLEQSFDLCNLAQAAGATYVARTTTFHAPLIPDFIVNAVRNKGFSLVEVVSACPVYYGRMNKMAAPVAMLKWQQQNAVNVKQAATMTPEEMKGKFTVGELHRHEAPEYTEEYGKLIHKLSQEKN
jgi:2-oxoglutarate ferredoxin oxidoreductase subunit beta